MQPSFALRLARLAASRLNPVFDAIIGLLIFAGGIAGAFFAGRRKQKQVQKVDTHNEYLATKSRIEAATKHGISDSDVDDGLRKHADKR
jgi:hypothetical protein